MGELNFIMQNYFQTGKPEAVQPVKIEYRTNAGKGVISIDLVRFFPASVHDVKVLIDTLWMSAEPYETAGIIADYLKKVIADLKALYYTNAYSENDKYFNSILSGYVKKYIANLDKIADAFGLESVTDENAQAQKMQKCEVVCFEFYNGKKQARSFPGYSFVKAGYTFHVTKKDTKNHYFIIVPSLGLSCADYNGTLKTAPEYIRENLISMLNRWTIKEWEPARNNFVEVCAETLENYTVPELPAHLFADQEPQTAPALDTEKEPQTAETNTACNQEPQTAEKPEKVKTEKPAHNVIKRSTAHIIARWKVETCAGSVGDMFDIKKTEHGWTGENITRKNGKFYNIPIAGLRNSELVEIVKQETAKEYFAHIMNNIITTEPKPADPTPETVTDRKPGEVWKPCTMTTRRFYGKIYCGFMSAFDQQNPGRAEPFKTVLRLAKSQGYTNIHPRHKNPVTGKIQAHNRRIIGTAYTPELIPGTTARNSICYGIVNRRVPRLQIRGSPILPEKKIGGFCGVYIRTPGGYLKVSR